MRNLKKVLSLTLALVMMLSMMTFAGAAETTKVSTATDLTDMKDVTNKEAVSLLVDLKVIAGRDDNTFDPAGSLKRAEFAKLIYVAKMGSDDKAANFINAATGLTDVAGTWFEGYVNYAFSTGIVSGTSKTTFTPNGLVKVAEAAKMLLVGLGYDAKAEGYTDNALWSVNVMQQAKQSGLLEGIKLGANIALTRDAAAQMVFNALMAKTVSVTYNFDMNGKKYITGAKVNTTTWGEEIFNLQKVEGTVTGISANTGHAFVNGVLTDLTAAPDVIGCKTAYYKNSSNGKLISSALLASKSTVLATSTDGTAISVLSDPTDKGYLAAADTAPTYYVNGAKETNAATYNADIAKAGVIVELIDTDANNKFDVVRVTKKTVDTVGEDAVTIIKATVVNRKDAIKVHGVTDLADGLTAAENVVGYEGLKEDDVVLSVKIGNKFYLEKAATVTGSVTGKKDGDFILGGNGYYESGLIATPASNLEYNKDLTLYLDNNKSIVKVVLNEKAAPAAYVVLTDLVFVANQTAGTVGGYAEAQLLHTDGTLEVVRISTIDGFTPVADEALINTIAGANWFFEKATAAALNAAVKANDDTTKFVAQKFATPKYYAAYKDTTGGDDGDNKPATDSVLLGKFVAVQTKSGEASDKFEDIFYTYKMSDGKCALTTVVTGAAADQAVAVSSATVTSGNPAVDTGVSADSKTTFLTKTVKNSVGTYAKYDGIAKVPSTTSGSANGQAILASGVTKIASFVYLKTGVLEDVDVHDYAYITKTTYTGYTPETKAGEGDDYFTFKAIVDGKFTTIKVAPNATGDGITNGGNLPAFNSAGFVTLTKGSDGIVTSAAVTADANPTIDNINNQASVLTGTKKAANGIIGVDTSYYTYADDAKVFFIDTKGDVTIGKISNVVNDVDDTVVVTVLDIAGSGSTLYKKTTVNGLYITAVGTNAGVVDGSDSVAPTYTHAFTVASVASTPAAGKITLTATVAKVAPDADVNWADGKVAMKLLFLNIATGAYEEVDAMDAVMTDGSIASNNAFTIYANGTYKIAYTIILPGAAPYSGLSLPISGSLT